jgi:DNA repair exonuclease SbcCD ATPase subunit
MLFSKLKINYFGRFQNREIELKPGINLIYGENEAGKSTIHTFIRGMLFGIERLRGRASASKEDLYTRYLPWEYPGAFGGSMDIQIGDKEYRLLRSFHASDKSFTVLDLSTGREIKLKEGLISELIPGLTEAAFKNTISIEQLKAQTDAELASQVRNYITNLSIAKSKEVNVGKAVSMLTEQKKQFDTVRTQAALNQLQTAIEEGLEKEEKIDQLTLQLKELLATEQQLKGQMEAASALSDSEGIQRMEQLPAMIEKFRTYQELSKQMHSLELQDGERRELIERLEKEHLSIGSIKEDISQTQEFQSKLRELEKQGLELQGETERAQADAKKNQWISIAPALAVAVLILIITGFQLIAVCASAIILVGGVAAYTLLRSRQLKKQSLIKAKKNSLEGEILKIREAINAILKRNHVDQTEALSQKHEDMLKNHYALENLKQQQMEAQKQKRELEDNRDVLYETIMKYMQFFLQEEELIPSSMQRLQEEIRQRRQESQKQQILINQQYDSCKLRIERIRWEISTMENNEEELLINKEHYQELEQKLKEETVQLEAIKLALATIQELGTDIHDSFGKQLNHAVSEIICEVTGERSCWRD